MAAIVENNVVVFEEKRSYFLAEKIFHDYLYKIKSHRFLFRVSLDCVTSYCALL